MLTRPEDQVMIDVNTEVYAVVHQARWAKGFTSIICRDLDRFDYAAMFEIEKLNIKLTVCVATFEEAEAFILANVTHFNNILKWDTRIDTNICPELTEARWERYEHL